MSTPIKNRKSFLAPFWCMLMILFLQLLIAINHGLSLFKLYLVTSKMEDVDQTGKRFFDTVGLIDLLPVLIVVALAVQCVRYYQWRTSIRKPRAAMLHIICYMLVFLVGPAAYIYFPKPQNEYVPLANTLISWARLILVAIGTIAYLYLKATGIYKSNTGMVEAGTAGE